MMPLAPPPEARVAQLAPPCSTFTRKSGWDSLVSGKGSKWVGILDDITFSLPRTPDVFKEMEDDPFVRVWLPPKNSTSGRVLDHAKRVIESTDYRFAPDVIQDWVHPRPKFPIPQSYFRLQEGQVSTNDRTLCPPQSRSCCISRSSSDRTTWRKLVPYSSVNFDFLAYVIYICIYHACLYVIDISIYIYTSMHLQYIFWFSWRDLQSLSVKPLPQESRGSRMRGLAAKGSSRLLPWTGHSLFIWHFAVSRQK